LKEVTVAQLLTIPEIELSLPEPPNPKDSDASPEQIEMTKAINQFSREALQSNTTNLLRSVSFIDKSFAWLRYAYGVMLAVGLGALVAAVIKGLFANTGSEAAAAGVIGGVSVALVLSSLVLMPTDSMERNAIFVPWMLLVLNTYWTRLVYMNDPKTIDTQLEDAAKDAAEQFKLIADAHAKAMTTETERFVGLAAPGSNGKAKDGKEGEKDKGKSGDGKTGNGKDPVTAPTPAPPAG
jgi:hypothetical protein